MASLPGWCCSGDRRLARHPYLSVSGWYDLNKRSSLIGIACNVIKNVIRSIVEYTCTLVRPGVESIVVAITGNHDPPIAPAKVSPKLL